MNKQQIASIALGVSEIAGVILTVLTAIPSSQAPSWVPISIGILTALVPYLKQQYGNTPQSVPGSTAAAIKAGVVAPVTPVGPSLVNLPTATTTHPAPVYPVIPTK